MKEHGLYVETTCRQKEAILQEILKDPEITIGIFSHTKPTGKEFYVLTRLCQESFALS
jgi:hypothetical protein